MERQWFLGVDGGQSSTTALIADETGSIRGSGTGGPCNHVGAAEGRAKLIAAITGCLSAACDEAGLGRDSLNFRAACLGFSGGPADKESILREIIPAGRLTVTTDAAIALTGATAGEPGLIVIAGTGSIALGRNAQGRMARAGGWGYLFGDEGGGFDLARRALRAILRFEEGWGPPTVLHARLLAEGGCRSANELMHALYTADWPRPRIAALSRLVDQAAREGDPVAQGLLAAAAQDLATLASAVRRQLFEPGETARICYIGGVFRSGQLRERFRDLLELEEGNLLGPPAYGPAEGALLEAFRSEDRSVTLTGPPRNAK